MRISSPFLYDTVLLPFELLAIRRWRRLLWSRVEGFTILEAGAGTGLNLPFYPPGRQVTLLDRDEAGLQKARQRARQRGLQVELVQGNVEALPFPDARFDSAVASFLLCSVQNPRQALAELHRVLKPGGQLLLLEHVRSPGLTGRLLEILSWPLYRLFEEDIARDTENHVRRAGFRQLFVQPLCGNVVKLIRAEKTR